MAKRRPNKSKRLPPRPPKIPRRPQTIDPQSLANVPLVRQMLADPQVKFAPRSVDRRWSQHFNGQSVGGFNPLYSAVFFPANSVQARWLADPYSSARKYNFGDALIDPVMFMVHDYLHVWSYRAINELRPRLGFGTKTITRRNIEDFVFCHLLTETVATLGLDYWYTATINLNEVCDLGTTEIYPNTAPYHERDADEYRKLNPRFAVQEPGFFRLMAHFYCSGQFAGFSRKNLQHSPLLWRWMRKEINYGELQRMYTRMWLSTLSGGVDYEPDELKAPVTIDRPWKRKLIEEIGRLLWEKVKDDRMHRFGGALKRSEVWTSPKTARLDFRFINLVAIRRELTGDEKQQIEREESPGVPGSSFDVYLRQFVARLDYAKLDKELLKLLPFLREKRDVDLVESVFKGQKRVARQAFEPRDLFMLS